MGSRPTAGATMKEKGVCVLAPPTYSLREDPKWPQMESQPEIISWKQGLDSAV